MEIKTQIKIKLDSKKEIVLDELEAKQLMNKLNEIFDKQTYTPYYPYYPYYPVPHIYPSCETITTDGTWYIRSGDL